MPATQVWQPVRLAMVSPSTATLRPLHQRVDFMVPLRLLYDPIAAALPAEVPSPRRAGLNGDFVPAPFIGTAGASNLLELPETPNMPMAASPLTWVIGELSMSRGIAQRRVRTGRLIGEASA